MFCYENVGQNDNVSITNRPFQNVAEFQYLGMTVTIRYRINEEIRNRTNLGSA
jgi:hypothetical protein